MPHGPGSTPYADLGKWQPCRRGDPGPHRNAAQSRKEQLRIFIHTSLLDRIAGEQTQFMDCHLGLSAGIWARAGKVWPYT